MKSWQPCSQYSIHSPQTSKYYLHCIRKQRVNSLKNFKIFHIFQTVRNLSFGVFSCHFQIFGMLKNILEQTSNKTIFISDSQQTELKSLPIAIGLAKLDPKKPSRIFAIETGLQSHLIVASF